MKKGYKIETSDGTQKDCPKLANNVIAKIEEEEELLEWIKTNNYLDTVLRLKNIGRKWKKQVLKAKGNIFTVIESGGYTIAKHAVLMLPHEHSLKKKEHPKLKNSMSNILKIYSILQHE